MSDSATVLGVTFFVLFISSRILKLIKGLKAVDHLPGIRCLFCPLTFPGAVLPNRSWNPGLTWPWYWRSLIYNKYKSETISVVPYLLGPPLVYTSSLEVAQQVQNSTLFDKAPETTSFLAAWGENIITSNHKRHKRHRRIVGPAFSGGIAPLVWEQTLQTYKELVVEEGWSKKSIVSIDCINDYTHKLALIQIARCAFGLSFPWMGSSSLDGEADLEKHMASVCNGVAIRGIVPRWMYKLPIKKLAEVENAYMGLGNFMTSLVRSQKAQIAAQEADSTSDLFSRLVRANEGQEEKSALDDDEVVGNVFAFLFAGHETTARTITSTLALLALHPEEQDIVVDEIRHVLDNGRDPEYSDYTAFTKVMGSFLEAVRMYPVVYIIVRDTTESVKLTTPTDEGDKTYVLAPGTRVVVDMTGVCYNSRHFPDPDVYKPSRWYSTQDSDGNYLFGLGTRSCLGRKFAMAEAVCFLTVLLRDWVISPLFREGETMEEWKNRVMQVQWGITFGIEKVPVKLSKRL